MKKLIYTLLLALVPATVYPQEWDKMVFRNSSDSLSIRENSIGNISLLIDESFIRNIPSPVIFKSLSQDNEQDLLSVANKHQLRLGGQVHLELSPVLDSLKGEYYRFNIFSEIPAGPSFFISYYPKRTKTGYFDSSIGSDDQGWETVILDQRTVKPEEKDLPVDTVKRDMIPFEYEQGDFQKLPQYVYSIDGNGKSYSSRVNRFKTGFRVQMKEDGVNGVTIVGTVLPVVPIKKEPGKAVYSVIVVMGDGRQIKRRIEVLTDLSPQM
jgi:hypothetical protein